MPIMTLFSSSFCGLESFADQIARQTGFQKMTDADVVKQAAILSGMDEKKIRSAFRAEAPACDGITRQKERATAWYDFDVPKLLLVDDEREFVQTLSERLLMREVHSATAFDGETALDILSEDEPEVMILDLKMPGIDGIEVLKKVKATRPEVEVIILTGHGSEQDRETCLSLGAFEYLQKPVDIDVLTGTLEKANEAIRSKRQRE